MDCEMYKLENVDGLDFLVSKERWYDDVITRVGELISECIGCPHTVDCEDKFQIIRHLDSKFLNSN